MPCQSLLYSTGSSSAGAEGRLPMAQGLVWSEDRQKDLSHAPAGQMAGAVPGIGEQEGRNTERSQLNLFCREITQTPEMLLSVGTLQSY